MAVEGTRASAVPYFYGRISRDEAETILTSNGCKEGLYLLRENVSTAGNYALSICHHNRIHHYCIERQPDGQVMIPDGRKFAGPVELIKHHSQYLDGFLTKPKIPCARPNGVAPMAWPGVTMLELEQILVEEAVENKKLQRSQLENALGPQRQKLIATVAQKLHKEQPWFHPSINRDQADKLINISRHMDGKFLVREKEKGSFALSLSYQGVTKHYKISRHKASTGDKLAIEDGPTFDNLMDMVAHYYNKSDGLLCKLMTPVQPKGYVKKNRTLSGTNINPIYAAIYGAPVAEMGISREVIEGDFDEPPDVVDVAPLNFDPHEITKVYDTVPRTDDVFNLSKRDVTLTRELGGGNFGSVMLGEYRHRNKTIPVAIKMLKQADMPTAEEELMREARLMANLNNPFIVRMIGVCRAESIMLILELAPLGPLNKYLKKAPMTSVNNITELMQQVAQGMAYLESHNFVHRDLAARNVLLANERLAKISDFGMSKALGIGNEYYKAEAAGKWPLKWYAPECIYFYKFDSKSDVWSYGVTLWEAMSYGAKPYRGMKGAQIVEMIDNERRLDKPDKCPQAMYDLILKCWQRKSEDRPTFQQIARQMEQFL